MPPSPLRTICTKLAARYGASVLTEIFQGESPKRIGSGVCRAIVAHWIGSNVQALATDKQGLVSEFRRMAEALKTGKTATGFLAHQGDFGFHRRAYEEAHSREKKAEAEVEKWNVQWKASHDPSYWHKWTEAGAERDRAREEARRLGEHAENYKTMFTASIKESSRGKLSALVSLFRHEVEKPGFYFISIGPKDSGHALGFYTCRNMATCVLIDPNTCEWVFPSLQAAHGFFGEYVWQIEVYRSWMNESCQLDYIGENMLYEPMAADAPPPAVAPGTAAAAYAAFVAGPGPLPWYARAAGGGAPATAAAAAAAVAAPPTAVAPGTAAAAYAAFVAAPDPPPAAGAVAAVAGGGAPATAAASGPPP